MIETDEAYNTLENQIIEVLEGAGLTDKPWEFDSSIHSWRCEHPDRYGECSCFADLVDDLMRVIRGRV